jgi:hypothetical protein
MKATLDQPQTMTIHVPMKFSLRGRKTVISAFARTTPPTKTDDALIKALARAHSWRLEIESGEYASITELAKTKRVNESYACRLLRLTLLAPSIVAAILNGRQDPDLTLKRLTKPFPIRWDLQLSAFKGDER